MQHLKTFMLNLIVSQTKVSTVQSNNWNLVLCLRGQPISQLCHLKGSDLIIYLVTPFRMPCEPPWSCMVTMWSTLQFMLRSSWVMKISLWRYTLTHTRTEWSVSQICLFFSFCSSLYYSFIYQCNLNLLTPFCTVTIWNWTALMWWVDHKRLG